MLGVLLGPAEDARSRSTNVARIALPVSPPWPRDPAQPATWGNASSANIVFSQDNRRVRLIAFDSAASNLVRRDPNGRRDVFVVHRDHGEGRLTGRVERVSIARRRGEPNGPSMRPSLDGETHARPHCVAFESRASNLTAGDARRDWDVFVRDLRKRRTALASPGLTGARFAVIDGRCHSLTFSAGGSVWVRDLRARRHHRIARGTRPDQQTNGEGVAYERAGQVWYRSFRLRPGGRISLGRERLVSDDHRGRRGNGRSSDPMLDDAGHYVAFESTATNLCTRRCSGISRDRNGRVSDVFRRTLSRRAPTRDSMQMVSFSHAVRAQGNGASTNPAISGAGENVVFESTATNLQQRPDRAKPDENGRIPDVYGWTYPRRRGHGNVILQTGTGCPPMVDCPNPSTAPSMSSRGNYIGFTGWWNDLCAPARPSQLRRPVCPVPSDAFVRFVGGSHEGYALG